MKSMIVYSSQSGNTRKLAETVYDALEGEKDIYAIEDAPDPEAYDLIALGFWLKAGKPDPASMAYLTRIGSQSLFLFGTHGAAADSDHAYEALNYAKSLAPGAKILDTFNCQGEVNPKLLEKARSKDQPPVWLADAPGAIGHPNEADFEMLRHKISIAMREIRLDCLL